MEWFRVVAVHRTVLEEVPRRLNLGNGDLVAHLVDERGDAYGVEGLGIDVLEHVFDGMVSFEGTEVAFGDVWLYHFRSIVIELDSPVVPRRYGVMYMVSRSSGARYRLGVAALCRDRSAVESLARVVGAVDAEYVGPLDTAVIESYLRSCPEIDSATLARVLRPVRSRIVSTPLSIDLADPSGDLYLGHLLDPLLRRKRNVCLPLPRDTHSLSALLGAISRLHCAGS